MQTRFYITSTLFLVLLFNVPVIAQTFLNLGSSRSHSSSQSYVNVEIKQVFSTFKYFDSQGTEDKTYSHKVVNAYGLGFQHTSQNGFFVRATVGLHKAGATLGYHNIKYIWSLQYTNIYAGIGFQFTKWRLKPYIALMPYYAYLLDASQTVNSDNYDIKANKAIKSSDFGGFIDSGFNIILTKYLSVYAEYNYIFGLNNIEFAQEEQLYNRGFSLNFGVALNITKISKLNLPRMQ